jgi:hypothetical protein
MESLFFRAGSLSAIFAALVSYALTSVEAHTVIVRATSPAQPQASSAFQTWLLDPKTLLSIPSAFGVGGILGFVLKRYFDRRDKRNDAAPKLRFHLQRLQKRFTIAYEHPGVDVTDDDLGYLIAEFESTVLASAGVFGRMGRILEIALSSSQTEGNYLAHQRNQALTVQLSRNIQGSARRALIAIYEARDALKDKTTVLWPPDSENRGLWEAGKAMRRVK